RSRRAVSFFLRDLLVIEHLRPQATGSSVSIKPSQLPGDCTDLTRYATSTALGMGWAGSDKASTGMFKSGDHPGYTEVDENALQMGDVVVQGGHAGIIIGRSTDGILWAYANNGSPHKKDGSGYSDKDTGPRAFQAG